MSHIQEYYTLSSLVSYILFCIHPNFS